MKNIIISVLVILLGISVYLNIQSKEQTPVYIYPNTDQVDNKNNNQNKSITPQPTTLKLSLVAKANYDQGHITGGNSQYFDLSITSNTDLGMSNILITQSTSATVPNPVPLISTVEKVIVINKGTTVIQRVLLGQITNVTINGVVVAFTQSYAE